MMKKTKTMKIRMNIRKLATLILTVLTVFGTFTAQKSTVQAADGKLTFNSGDLISYGDYYTAKMTFDGSNTAYCLEPMKQTPSAGSYSYNLLAQDSPVRKALYYLPGGYGYEGNIQKKYLSGWSTDNAYVIGHLTVAYVYAGYEEESGAFYGAPQNYITKAKEVAAAIRQLPAPPSSFRAFVVPGNDIQSITGSWYAKPNGWIELHKSGVNTELTQGNPSYSLENAVYGIYKGNTQVGSLTTDENGYAKSAELEEGSYRVQELTPARGYALDSQSYQVEVKSEQTATLQVSEVPQNNPVDILIQKVDAETEQNKPQGKGTLGGAEFTVKYYKNQVDTYVEQTEKTPDRTWIFRTDSEGVVKFTEEYFVSGDTFYYQEDQKTICLPLGTITIQETKAPEGYLLNSEIYGQAILPEGTEETIQCFQTAIIKNQICRGNLELVKVSDGDLKRLADVPFKLTSKTTGESHVITTDRNGYANTEDTDIWFGDSELVEGLGRLPYDSYVLEEQECEANKGMKLLTIDVEIYKDKTTVKLGTLTNDKIDTPEPKEEKEEVVEEPKKEVIEPQKTVSNGNAPKTGDTNRMPYLIVVMVGAMGVVIVVKVVKKKTL